MRFESPAGSGWFLGSGVNSTTEAGEYGMIRRRANGLAWSFAIMLLAACGGDGGDAPPPAETTPAASEPTPPPAATTSPTPAEPTPSTTPGAAPGPATLETPATFRVQFETSKGNFVVEVDRSLAPLGVDRFYRLINEGYYDDVRFFRVIAGFMAQFGMHGDPAQTARWRAQRIQDDPVVGSNTRGTITFATSGPNSRTTQLFINLVDNRNLDGMGFAPFGRVVEGIEVVDQLYSGYGEGAPQGQGPSQGNIQSQGNAYLMQNFPLLDYIIRARVVN
jgi:peptidyl-prolyl cis-trans isomerase A (cyclophilin A)